MRTLSASTYAQRLRLPIPYAPAAAAIVPTGSHPPTKRMPSHIEKKVSKRPDGVRIVPALCRAPECTPMPMDEKPLDERERELVKRWIERGAPED